MRNHRKLYQWVALGLILSLPPIGARGITPRCAEAGPVPDVVSVSLVEGWNLVGWTGDDTLILEATADIADQFNDLRTFDSDSGAVLRFRDGVPSHENSLTELRYGMGMWVLAGEATTWTHAPRAPSTTVALQPGFNLIAWLGEDDTSVAAAVESLGSAVLTAHTWDRDGQRFRRHLDTGETAFLNESANLMRGDALWLEMAVAVDWAQTATGADEVSAVADSNGASLVHPDGASIDVPPGALPVGTPISLFRTEAPPNLPDHVTWVGQAYEVRAGAVLDGIATVRVPDSGGVDPADLEMFRLGSSNAVTAQGAVLEDGALVARTGSFSIVTAGIGRNELPIVGPQLVLSGTTVVYLIGDAGLANNLDMVAQWEFENDPESDIFAEKVTRTFDRQKLVTFKSGANGSGTIRVKITAPGLTASGELSVQATTTGPTVEIDARDSNGEPQHLGDSITFEARASGGTPPYDFEIDFDEGDPVYECLDCAATITRSNVYETPGLKTVTVAVTDASLQFATAQTSIAVASSTLDCELTAAKTVMPADTTGKFQVAISGGAPGYTVDWLLTSFGNVGGPPALPQFASEAGKDGRVIQTFTWMPDGEGTYDFVAVVEDAVGAQCRRSIQVRVPPFGIVLNDPPVGIQPAAPFTISGSLAGLTGDCFVRFEGDDGELIGAVVTSTNEFELSGIKLDRVGTHELTIRARCFAVAASVKHVIQVLDGTAGWVRGFPVANPVDLPLLAEFTTGTYERCHILLPTNIAYDWVTKVNGVEDPTADLEFAFTFEPPPLQIAPGSDEVELDLSGVVSGFSNGSRNRTLRLAYTGSLVTSSEEAVVELDGIALAANPPPGRVAMDEATATAEFPDTGGDVGFIDISVALGSAGGCRVRWSYDRIPAASGSMEARVP